MMILEKAIRRRQSPLPPQGHHEVDSEITAGLPLLELQPQTPDPQFVDELAAWPQKIELLVHWQQVPLGNAAVSIQEIVSGMPLGTNNCYGDATSDNPDLARAARNQAIALHYHGQALLVSRQHEETIHGVTGDEISLGITQEHPLYQKPYMVQGQGQLVQVRESLGEGRWLITAPKTRAQAENMVPLLAYGCHAPLGCRFVDIEQLYASVGAVGKETSLRLYKESLLKREGVVQPGGGTSKGWHYQFVDSHAAPTSLIADIMTHRIRIPVTFGDIERTYVSAGYRESLESDQLIYLTFKPQ
jgi:hypothetical protein